MDILYVGCCNEATILSDSQSVLRAIFSRDTVCANYLNHEIKSQLCRLTHDFIINLVWIPGKGHPVTKMPYRHQLANEAAMHGRHPKFKVLFHDFMILLKGSFNTKFQLYLDHSAMFKGQLYDSLYHRNNESKIWFYSKKLKWKKLLLQESL